MNLEDAFEIAFKLAVLFFRFCVDAYDDDLALACQTSRGARRSLAVIRIAELLCTGGIPLSRLFGVVVAETGLKILRHREFGDGNANIFQPTGPLLFRNVLINLPLQQDTFNCQRGSFNFRQ